MAQKHLANMRARLAGLTDAEIERHYQAYVTAPTFDNTYLIHYQIRTNLRHFTPAIGVVFKWLNDQKKIIVRTGRTKKLVHYNEIEKIEKGI